MPLDGPLLQPTPTTGGRLPATDGAGTSRAIANEEHQQALIRARRVFKVGTVLWVGWLPLDYLACHAYGDGNFTPFVIMRLLGGALIGIGALFVMPKGRTPLTPVGLKILDSGLLAYCAFGVSLMCLRLGGINSPYAPGVATTIGAAMMLAHEPWRGGITTLALPGLAWPATMLVAAAVDPAIAAQLASPSGLAHFLLYSAYIGTAVLWVVVSGHLIWALRRQLFENRQLGRYRLKRRIAAGGMGEVWSAYHPGLKHDVAVKVLRAQAGDDVALTRFEREVKATSALTHPNTIRIFDFGVTDDGVWFYVMELLDGMDLSTLVRRVGPLSPGRTMHLMLQATRALAEAHRRGIVHRDIKPQNLFSCAVGGEVDYVKVLDFGIARTLDVAVEVQLTATGTVPGTPKYMAPEVSVGQPATPASDVYSLGAVVYFLLTGKAPYDIDNVSQLLVAQQTRPPELPSRVREEPLPEGLEALIMRSLERAPEARFVDATAFAAAMSALPAYPREADPAFPLERAADGAALPLSPLQKIAADEVTRTLKA